LTKQVLIDEKKVRMKTMKVTVKASEYEKAMNPEIWPQRVGVRLYRAPARRPEGEGGWTSQAGRHGQPGGRIDERPRFGQGQERPFNNGGQQNPWKQRNQRNRMMSERQQGPSPIMLKNMFQILTEFMGRP
jgi:hypothetical protein